MCNIYKFMEKKIIIIEIDTNLNYTSNVNIEKI